MTPRSGYLQRLRRQPARDRRDEVERLLRGAWPALGLARAVRDAAATLARDDLAVGHYTFDDPEFAADAATLQVTFQFGGPLGADGVIDEIRGSAIVVIDDGGEVRFLDVDAEPYRLLDDVGDGAAPARDD